MSARRYNTRTERAGYGLGFVVPLVLSLVVVILVVITAARMLFYAAGELAGVLV